MSNIDNVVKEKRLRYKSVRNSNYKTDGTIFRNISKPRDPIKYLCKAFCVMMRFLTNDEAVKSSILYCKNSKIGEILAVCGEDSLKCNVEEFNNSSLAKDVVEIGKSIIINDTDESEKFYKPKGCKAKSALAMPVFDGDELVFVVCFSSPNKKCFREKELLKYEKIIEEISDRVLLEWHLHELLKKQNMRMGKKNSQKVITRKSSRCLLSISNKKIVRHTYSEVSIEEQWNMVFVSEEDLRSSKNEILRNMKSLRNIFGDF